MCIYKNKNCITVKNIKEFDQFDTKCVPNREKIHGRVKILGWSKKQHGTFSGSKLVADSKNVDVLEITFDG
jgi:hypothetical protein